MNEQIYIDYHERVLRYIQSRVNDINLAEDLTSDVFLKIYEKIDTFDETKASLSTWIFTITRNRLTDYYRVRRVHSEVPETMEEDFNLEDAVCNQDTLEALADALEQMPERERDIIILRYYSGKTLKDIAARLDISYAYVKLLHNKALMMLREYLEDSY